MIKKEVLPVALHMFLKQYQEKTPQHEEDPDPVDQKDNPVVRPPPAMTLQVHGGLDRKNH
jgi:hypothetical protein